MKRKLKSGHSRLKTKLGLPDLENAKIAVIVTADLLEFYRVWLGHSTLSDALRKEQVHLDGTPADLRAFPQWFTWSPMADTVRAALADRSRTVPRSSKSKTQSAA